MTRFRRVMGADSPSARPPRGLDPGERRYFPPVFRDLD